LLGLSSVPAIPGETWTLAVFAPGYPSTTSEAQPTMDELAGCLARGAGWPGGRVKAVYHPTLDGGLASFADEATALALVPLPLYLEYRERFRLEPLLWVDPETGQDEVWSLVAAPGAITAPRDLDGWELVGMPGYSERFVRRVVLSGWGVLPESVRIGFSPRVLSALRRAAEGEKVAALLDRAQASSLASLPFGERLAVVARSPELPWSLLCRVGERLGAEPTREITAAFLGLGRSQGESELLSTMRLRGARHLDPAELTPFEKAFDAGPAR
jgi:hypothetical protein